MAAEPSSFIKALTEAPLPPHVRECPFCRQLARSDASVCPHCTRDIAPLPVRTVRTNWLALILLLGLCLLVAVWAWLQPG